MKFRFCGDLDVPDWLLKEIAVLSKLTAIKIRLLATEVANQLQGGSVDVRSLSILLFSKHNTHYTPVQYEKIAKNTAANFDVSDVKAIIAALHFILNNGAKYDVGAETLETELQQLGLPKENAEAISRVLQKNKEAIRANFAKKTLSLNKLVSVDWRVDYIISSSYLEDLAAPSVQLRLKLKSPSRSGDQETTESFEVNADKFRVLLHELKAARALMEGI